MEAGACAGSGRGPAAGAELAGAVCGRRREHGLPAGAGATGAVIVGGGGQRRRPRPAAGPAATVEGGGPRRR